MTIQHPETKQRSDDETVTTHPAFAQIGAARCQGGQINLYGSDFTHQHFMTISIHVSELHRSLNRDWYFGRNEIIEVALSEAQWATFVSSPNIGNGVPCTIHHMDGNHVPKLPPPEKREAQFSTEMKESLRGVIAKIDDMISSAKTNSERKKFELLRQDIVSNLPFVSKQFDEHMEQTVESAKAEIHGYMTGVIQRAGLEALSGDNLPLQINDEAAKEDETA